MVLSTKQELMRECVVISTTTTGWMNSVFNITIPEGYALELHYAEFICKVSANLGAVNNVDALLSDDQDEIDAVGHSEEKVLASTYFTFDWITGGTNMVRHENRSVHETFRQLLVNPPNFHINQTEDGAHTYFCRIWFDFIKISPAKILELLRQQQY